MDIAQSGDFGISSGPWEIQNYQPYTEPVLFGHYLSVWKKQSDGTWRVILDTGVGHERQKGFELAFSFPTGADKSWPSVAKVDREATRKGLLGADRAFMASWKKNPSKETYLSYLSTQARMFRDGLVPTANRDSIQSRIPSKEKMFAWEPIDSDCSAAGDIGFTYGLIEFAKPDGSTGGGHYVRVWKKEQGSLKITIDLVSEN
jgi:ketosteroid isomerase-like protein